MNRSQDTVGLFIPSLGGGGAERVTVYTANGLAERGYHVDLVVISPRGSYLDLLSDKVHVVDLNCKRVATSIFPLARYLRMTRPAVLFSALEHASPMTFVAKWISRSSTRLVPVVHITLSRDAANTRGVKSVLIHRAVKWFYPHAAALVAVSQDAAVDMVRVLNVPERAVRVIYPVLTPDIKQLAGQPITHPWFGPEQPEVILAAGRLQEQKDFVTLIRAFGMVRRQRNAKLLILGEGVLRPQLEALIRELELTEFVSLPGYTKDIFAYMARCSLFVLSSAWEAMPMVITEALACGIPVVATNCPSGPREILCDGKYGRLVPVGDAEAMAKAMLDTLAEPRHGVCEEALRPYAFDTVIDQYVQLIGEVIGA